MILNQKTIDQIENLDLDTVLYFAALLENEMHSGKASQGETNPAFPEILKLLLNRAEEFYKTKNKIGAKR